MDKLAIDKNLEALVRNIIKYDITDIIAHEIQKGFQPIQNQVNIWQTGQDGLSKQMTEDRKDINQNTIDIGTIAKATGVIISNQSIQEEKVVKAVEDATKKIPAQVQKSVDKIFENKSFMRRIVDKILK